MRELFRTKTVEQILADHDSMPTQLRRALGPVQLTALGVGAMVGAGIFATVGTAAAGGAHHVGAGPALVISFFIVSIACGFAALCYAEFASLVPISGSAYTYAYATLGELIAWIIGWDLILEYAIGNVAVAISWSDYFQELLKGFGIQIPAWLGTDYRSALHAVTQLGQFNGMEQAAETLGPMFARHVQALTEAPRLFGIPIVLNLPAIGIVSLVTWILVIGIRESAWFNSVMVAIKLATIVFFLIVGACYVQPENWRPFAPNGLKGITSAAAIIFFAYIGFDAVSTAAEEARNPQRDMPVGIIASLLICTALYSVVALVLTGMERWDTLGTADPLAAVFGRLGMHWAAGIVSAGALVATTSVLIAFQLGQPRIFFSMARDGLLPRWAAAVHPKYRTPYITTILTGIFVALFAGITNIEEMVELTNIGTLFAFILVAVGIIVLRYRRPDLQRPFRTPLVPWIPLMAIVSCLYLMCHLPKITWLRFVLWLGFGLVFYLCYGRRYSRLGQSPQRDETKNQTPMHK